MKIKNIFLFLTLIISLFSFTGCYNSTGIDRQYFIISLGLDISSDNLLKISIQIPSPSSGKKAESSGSAQASNYQIYSVEAQTIDEGIAILNNYLNKKINLSHCSALIISEELARKGVETYINTLTNNPLRLFLGTLPYPPSIPYFITSLPELS